MGTEGDEPVPAPLCRVWGRGRPITLSINRIHEDGKGISRDGSIEIPR